jgi:uroporphyrinogen III methyltransferase/synthase
MSQPLKNKSVLITRAADQSAHFIHQLQSLGATTLLLPLIKTTPINASELKRVFNSRNYDWLIFTSTNAVKFFFNSIQANGINCKIAAVGEKTKKALKEIGIPTDFIPSQFTAKQLAKELPISENDSILIPRSDIAKNDGVEILENRHCSVKTISIYKNSSLAYSNPELHTIFSQKIDFITFTSGSTVNSFIRLGLRIRNEKVICIGPQTAKVAKENRLHVSAIANPHTIEGMVEALLVMVRNEE